MNAIYLTRQDGDKIEIAEFLAIIGNLTGVANIRKENVFRASAEADYYNDNDRTIIRLDEDQKLIAITGVGKASIRAAFEIQRRYDKPLRLFDMDYTCDVGLSDVNNVQELMDRMNLSAQQ